MTYESMALRYWLPVPVTEMTSMVQLVGEAQLTRTFELSQQVVKLLHQYGVPLLAGSDVTAAGPRSVHQELALFVEAGLTPAEALRTATLHPARYLNAVDSLGTVAPGKLADLVLLEGDPLADIANTMRIRAVVANGRYFDRAALDRLLAEVQAAARRQP